MEKELKILMLKIRKEKPKQVFISSSNKFDTLFSQMTDEIRGERYSGRLGGFPLQSYKWFEKGYDNFVCMGIPVVLKERIKHA